MAVPSLRIPITAEVTGFQSDMSKTSALVTTATRAITSKVIEMNAGFLASQGTVGATTLAFGRMLPVIGQVLLAITVIKDTFNLMAYATELAKQKIEEFNQIASKANDSGFSTDFFQRITKSSGEARDKIDDVTAALKRFNDSTAPKLGGSELQQRLDELKGAGNFTGNTGVAQLGAANTNEDKFRAVVSLIDQALDKGEKLAALDLAGKAFGPSVASALQKDSGYLDAMLQRADAISKSQIISPEDVGRAIELKERMDAAQKTLAEKWKPIQDDLAKLGMNYHESWVGITESIASAVGYATDLYKALQQVPDWFAKAIGGATIFTSIANSVSPENRKAAEDAYGISSDPRDIALLTASNKLRAGLQNHANVTAAGQQATDIGYAVRKDTSHNPDKPDKSGGSTTDAVDPAINSLRRHAEQTEADTAAVGLGAGALARFRAEAQETSAVQANGGKETDKQADAFQDLQDRAEAAATALAKANVANQIARGQQTALLSPEDVQIANQLKEIYPDVATALDSVEASALRTNQAISGVSSQLSGDLTSGLTDITTGTKSVKDGFGEMATAIIKDIEQMIIKLTVVGPLMRGLQGGFGSLFGLGDDGVNLGSSSNPLAGLDASDYGVGFASGGYTGSGGRNQPAGLVHAGEVVWSQDDISRAGGVAAVEAMRRGVRGYANGGIVMPTASPAINSGGGRGDTYHTPITISIDATGADPAQLQRTQVQIAQLKAELPSRVVAAVTDAKKRRLLQ